MKGHRPRGAGRRGCARGAGRRGGGPSKTSGRTSSCELNTLTTKIPPGRSSSNAAGRNGEPGATIAGTGARRRSGCPSPGPLSTASAMRSYVPVVPAGKCDIRHHVNGNTCMSPCSGAPSMPWLHWNGQARHSRRRRSRTGHVHVGVAVAPPRTNSTASATTSFSLPPKEPTPKKRLHSFGSGHAARGHHGDQRRIV